MATHGQNLLGEESAPHQDGGEVQILYLPANLTKGYEMQFHDKLTIDEKRRTRDGYMTVNARVARGGNIQLYTGAEVGKADMATVRVYRPADEVFSPATMNSFAHRPVTFGHPDAAVTADTWKTVAKGWTDGEVVREGEFVRVNMLLADAEAISAVDAGTRELSMGYDCTLDWTSGVTPSGEAYDAVQRGIRSNHVAIVGAARGGSELRLGDGLTPTPQRKAFAMMNDAEIRTMRDSVRGMPLAQAAALPIYDDFRGLWNNSMPAAEYYAITDGAIVGPREPTVDEARVHAAYDHMVAGLSNACRNQPAVNDNKASEPEFTRDGRRLSDLAPHDRAYEEMLLRQSDAWKK